VGVLVSASILVVEEHDDSRDMLCTVLSLAGAVAHCVESIEKAITTARATRPDAVVADLWIASQDLFLIRQIRHEVGRVPAICLSVDSRPNDRERALEAGFDVFLVKPVQPDHLVAAIERVLIPKAS
jgi:DNA-binding response OmpR family regulator